MRFEALRALGSRWSALLAAGALALGVAGEARADAPGATALRQARAAWDRGSHELAEPHYREALEKGGLAPNEVLEGYVRLGTIRAALGKKESAIAAFRAASILDDKFTVPPDGGSKAVNLAEKAKRDTARIGSIQLAVQVPKEVPPGKSFKVTATLDKGHLPIVHKIGLLAKDGTTGKDVSLDSKPDESVEFEIASDITLPGASILIHVDALDSHMNRLASSEERVRVPDKEGGPIAAGGGAKPTSSGPVSDPNGHAVGKPLGGDTGVKKGGGFWSSPFPYVIGGLVVVGVGAAVYFGTRPTPNVTVGSVGVGAE